MNTRSLLDTKSSNGQLAPFIVAVLIVAAGIVISLAFTGLPR